MVETCEHRSRLTFLIPSSWYLLGSVIFKRQNLKEEAHFNFVRQVSLNVVNSYKTRRGGMTPNPVPPQDS